MNQNYVLKFFIMYIRSMLIAFGKFVTRVQLWSHVSEVVGKRCSESDDREMQSESEREGQQEESTVDG